MANPYNLKVYYPPDLEGEPATPSGKVVVPGFLWDCLEFGVRDNRLTIPDSKALKVTQLLSASRIRFRDQNNFAIQDIEVAGLPPFTAEFLRLRMPREPVGRDNLGVVFLTKGSLYRGNDAIARADAMIKALKPMLVDCRHKEIEPIARIGLPGGITQKIVGMVQGERARPEAPRVARPPRTLTRKAGEPEGPAAAGAPQGGRRKTRKPRRKSKKTLRRR